MERRNLLLVAAVGLVVLAGVWTALLIDPNRPQVVEPEAGRESSISEITLATLRAPEEERKQDPVLKQQMQYQTGQPLALRVTTTDQVRGPIQLNVRLVNAEGGFAELSPSSVAFEAGTSTFCCWRISEPGRYTLQIFRPERTVTSIPVTIRQGF